MRPTLLLASLVFSLGVLASPAARAAEPSDPFAAAPAAASAALAVSLPDPFSAAPAPVPVPSADALTDPFAVAPAPSCPVRTTTNGVVIQRPASAPCPDEGEEVGLRDPFGA